MAAGGCGAWGKHSPSGAAGAGSMDELHRGQRQAGDRANDGAPVRACRAERGLLIDLSVHELVDDLCKTAAGLCAGGEILGIAAVSRG